jgi:N utilization substance protein B
MNEDVKLADEMNEGDKPLAPKKKKGSAIARKRMSRLMASQALYQILMTDTPVDDVLRSTRDKSLLVDPDEPVELIDHDDKIFLSIIRSWQAHQEQILTMLKEAFKNKMQEPEMLLKAILMAGAAELIAHNDIDGPIIIKDYMTITESFFDNGEQKIVNAILDRIQKVVR